MATGDGTQRRFGFLWSDTTPSGLVPQAVLDKVVARYAKCRNYRDRGTVVTTFWRPRRSTVRAARFDTLFVRDVGFRFRFSDEQGRLKHAIWSRGQKTQSWSLGQVSEGAAEDASVAGRGVTSFTSQIVPGLLLGASPFSGERSFVRGTPSAAGTGPTECGKCWLVAFGITGQWEDVFAVDESHLVLRRVQSVRLVSDDEEDGGAIFASDTAIFYEPQVDVPDEAPLVQELQVQPW
jgi:hypothetical protein